jgi:hypothetical protein
VAVLASRLLDQRQLIKDLQVTGVTPWVRGSPWGQGHLVVGVIIVTIVKRVNLV